MRAHQFVRVIDKLEEARFFLHKLEGASSFLEACYFTSALLSAGYSVWECLKKTAEAPPELISWFKTTEAALKADPVAQYFHLARNAEVHEGENTISGMSSVVRVEGDRIVTRQSFLMKERGSRSSYAPQVSPAEECKRFVSVLVRLVLDGYRRHRALLDPDGAWAKELESFEREFT